MTGTFIVSSRSTSIKSILLSARQPKHCITAPIRLRKFERKWPLGKPLHLRLMFNSTVRTPKPHRIGPDAGQGRVVNVKLKINMLSGFRAPTNQITHRVAHKSKKKEGDLLVAFLRLGWFHRAR